MTDNHIFHRSDTGFTLVEIIVAIAISGIIFIAVSTLIGTLFSGSARVTQLDALSQIKDDIGKDMSNAIRWAKVISVSAGNDKIDLTTTDGSSIVYRLIDRQLYKNDTLLHPTDYEVTNFSAYDYGSGSQSSIAIEIGLRSKKFTARSDTIKLVISQRQTDVTVNN